MSDEKLSKEFCHSKKSASYNQTIFFASKKTHISIKLNTFNIKRQPKSIVPEVIQRLSAKFGENWSTGGTITDVNAFFPLTSILKSTFINIIFMYFLNRARFSDIGPAHFCCTVPLLSHHTLININAFFLVTLIFCCNNRNVMKQY